MTIISDTAYPQLKTTMDKKEFEAVFSPNEQEYALMHQHTKPSSLINQAGFMITLKCYQCLGRTSLMAQVPKPIKDFIVDKLHITVAIDLESYSTSSARKRHINIIRKYLNINLDKKSRKACLWLTALDAAATKENLADIINSMIDELIKHYFELPSFRDLLRMARHARVTNNQNMFTTIFNQLSTAKKTQLDALFDTRLLVDNQLSHWAALKQEPKKPTVKNIKHFIMHMSKLCQLKDSININIDFVPPKRFEQFVSEAISMDVADMRKLKQPHRYFLAVLLIHFRSRKSADELIEVFIRWMRKLHSMGKDALTQYRLDHVQETDELVQSFHAMLLSYAEECSEVEKIEKMDSTLNGDVNSKIEKCERHLDYADNNYHSFMLKPYKNKRHVFFLILEQLDIKSATQEHHLTNALEIIKDFRRSSKTELPTEYVSEKGKTNSIPIYWLSEKWVKSISGKTKEKQLQSINRHYYEIAILTELAEDLNCGDVYVDGAYHYDDPNKELISMEALKKEVDNYCKLVHLEVNKHKFVTHLRHKLHRISKAVNDRFVSNEYLTIEKGKPILKKSPQTIKAADLNKISQLIAKKMPLTNIVDVITDAEQWLNLSANFKPLSGLESKIADYPSRFVATTYAYGCNVGPTQGELSLQRYTRKQIAWLFNHHITKDKLDDASVKTVNMMNQFELPTKWGPGDSISVDATYWDMYTQNIRAAHHIRYGQYGGLGYYQISDRYMALYGNFIPCGIHESNYLFDGIIDNDSDIKIDKVHGDTGAQSEIVFAFAYLLAIQLMPRIRSFKHLRYYKARKTEHYKHIDDLFCEQSINWVLIALYYHDMLRIIISIRYGKIKASTILRKFCSKSKKNKLYFAFRELGRVIRTLFLLEYISDIDLRKIIHAATCKSEEFNQFVSWCMYGNGGTIADNMSYNQNKIIKFGKLLANIVMLHVTANMTQAINQLKTEGIDISDEVLNQVSPFRTEYINRFGIFPVDQSRKTIDLVYDLL